MTQQSTQAIGAPFSRRLNVSDMNYAYEVDTKTGFCAPVIAIADIAGVSVGFGKKMGETDVCPIATGACVSSPAGGLVEGWDMYGQFVAEIVAPGGTSTIAFAGITGAPSDAQWANRFGLPYKWKADAATPNQDVTLAPPADDEDSRGTFSFGGSFNDTDPYSFTEVEVPYIADRTALFGVPYSERFDATTEERFATDIEVTATVDAAGAVAVTIASTGSNETPATITFPDGTTVRGASGSIVNHTLSPLWMSKYARQIGDDQTSLDRLIAVAFDWPVFRNVNAVVSGSLT